MENLLVAITRLRSDFTLGDDSDCPVLKAKKGYGTDTHDGGMGEESCLCPPVISVDGFVGFLEGS